MQAAKRKSNLSLELLLWIIALLHVYPIFLILLSSLKSKSELAMHPMALPKHVTWSHFSAALDSLNYLRSFFNTAVITILTVAGVIVLTTAAAYAISRRNTKLYGFLYVLFIAGLIVPFQMTMIPLYKMMVNLSMINTYYGIVLVYIAIQIPFALFVFVGFLKTVPRELEEAAVIDGCGMFKTFFLVVFPLLQPAIATIAIIVTFHTWNDFLQAMLFLPKTEMKTLVVQLFSFVGEYNNDWSSIFAAIMLIVYPIVLIYIFAQRFIIKGLTSGALKG